MSFEQACRGKLLSKGRTDQLYFLQSGAARSRNPKRGPVGCFRGGNRIGMDSVVRQSQCFGVRVLPHRFGTFVRHRAAKCMYAERDGWCYPGDRFPAASELQCC